MPLIKRPPFAPAGEVVNFALVIETKIAFAAETSLAAKPASADEPALEGNPTVLFALFGEPTQALAGDPTVMYARFGEPTLALAFRYVNDVRTRDLLCCKNRTAELTTSVIRSQKQYSKKQDSVSP